MCNLLIKDIGALSEENFDAVDWINKTLKKTDDQQNKEVAEIVVSSIISDDSYVEFAYLGSCLVTGVKVTIVCATSKFCSGRN